VGRRLDALLLGPARRARAMRKRLDALDRADARARAAGLDPYDEWLRSRHPRSAAPVPEPRRRGRLPLLVLIALLVVPVAIYLARHREDSGHALIAAPSTHELRPSNVPPPSKEEHDRPLGVPAPAPPGRGGYRVERAQPGGDVPVTWDPCRPIHYVISGRPPAGLGGLIASVVDEMSRTTGLRFIADGATTELAAGSDRAAYLPSRYPKRWAPVLVAWTDPQQVPTLDGDVIGLGGATEVTLGKAPATYVSGIVYLDGPQFARQRSRPTAARGTQAMRAVVLHEFGHLLGLAHVTDPTAVMYPETSLQVTGLSAGDRRGLRALSTGPCVPSL
jgi:Matrixin